MDMFLYMCGSDVRSKLKRDFLNALIASCKGQTVYGINCMWHIYATYSNNITTTTAYPIYERHIYAFHSKLTMGLIFKFTFTYTSLPADTPTNRAYMRKQIVCLWCPYMVRCRVHHNWGNWGMGRIGGSVPLFLMLAFFQFGARSRSTHSDVSACDDISAEALSGALQNMPV